MASNKYLLAQNKMKVGKFEGALVDSQECIAMAERLKDEFAEDYATVVSKFML